jgi:hypothetical protein
MRLFAVAMSIWLRLLGTAFAGESDCSAQLDAPKERHADRPILVLVETNPWAMVLGSDSPRFALYDDGVVIYRTKDGFRHVRLDAERAEDLRKAVNVNTLSCLKKNYSTSSWTDQPSEYLFFGRGGRLSHISVYGRIPGGNVQTDVPPPLIAAYERLANFDDPKSQPWMPDFIEVVIWPYDYAPEPSIIWPSKWPGLSDPRTIKRGNGYSLYVPSKDFEALHAFLGTEREKGAVEIGGKKWSVNLRFPFPQEASWQFKVSDPE